MPSDFDNLGGHAAPLGNSFDRRKDIGDGGIPGGVVAGAHVERQFAASRNDVDQAVRHRKLTDGTDQCLGSTTALFDRKNNFRGSSGRVVTKRHRHRSGMAGDALNVDAKTRRAGDRGDDTKRQIPLQKNRPLFDMYFEMAAGFPAAEPTP